MTPGVASCIHSAMMVEPKTKTEAESPHTDATRQTQDIVRQSGTSFYWAMRRLPEEKRNAMYAIYAFCREVDDIADGSADVETKRSRLGEWRGEVERLYGKRPRHGIAKALLEPVDRFALHKEDFRAVIDGMEMDAAPKLRIADMAELELYCDRVACAVGRLSVKVFGLPNDIGVRLAFAQGQALQLTNILRDIDEDAVRDRLYLPQDLLHVHGIGGEDLSTVLSDPALEKVCELLYDVAKRRYGEARALVNLCERTDARPAVMMLDVYEKILGKLGRRGWRNLKEPVGLSTLEKIWAALLHGLF